MNLLQELLAAFVAGQNGVLRLPMCFASAVLA